MNRLSPLPVLFRSGGKWASGARREADGASLSGRPELPGAGEQGRWTLMAKGGYTAQPSVLGAAWAVR